MRVVADTVREPRLGVAGAPDSAGRGVRITALQPGGVAEKAGVKVGDILIRLDDLAISDPNFGAAFRQKFRDAEGQDLPIQVIRGADTVKVTGKVQLSERVESKIVADSQASAKAVRIRDGLLKGQTGG
jgi:S1-C subfamily serine protease